MSCAARKEGCSVGENVDVGTVGGSPAVETKATGADDDACEPDGPSRGIMNIANC